MPLRSDPSRRTFLGRLGVWCAAGLVAPLARASSASTKSASDSMEPDEPVFRFLAVNDLHHASAECTAFLERLVAQMKTHGPVDFCLIIGDLTDAGLDESFVAVRRTFSRLGVPIHTVPGNHDCDVTFDTSVYAGHFPNQLNYVFRHRGWQFVALDSTDGNAWRETRISDATLSFIDQALPQLDSEAPTVVFTHFPLAQVPRLTPINAEEILVRFDSVNLRAALCGHYHAHTVSQRREARVLTHPCCSRMRGNHDDTLTEGYVLGSACGDGRLVLDFIEFAEASRKADPTQPAT